MSSRAQRLVAAAAILLLAVSVHVGSLSGEFVYDDHALITASRPLVEWAAGDPGTTGRLLGADYAQTATDSLSNPIDYFRPVITASYMIDATFWGSADGAGSTAHWTRLDPFGFHLTNVLLHAFNALLVWTIARRLGGNALGWIAASLFAVHPIHTESVAWISGRTDLIGTACFLLAWALYDTARRRGSSRALGSAVGVAVIGVFAKETVAMIGPAICLHEAVVYGPASVRRRWRAVFPFFAVVAVYFVVRIMVVGESSRADGWAGVSTVTIAASFARACAWYVGRILWPWPLDLYPMLGFVGPVGAIPYVAGLVVAVAITWFAWRRGVRLVAFGLVGFGLMLAPLSCLVSGARLLRYAEDVDFPVAERFLYLPSVYALIAIAALLVRLRPRAVTVAVTLGLAITGAVVTTVRTLDWRDELALFGRAIETAPASVRMRTNFGLELVQAYRLDEARRELEHAIRRQEAMPSRAQSGIAYHAMAVAHGLEGDLAAALRFEERAAAIDPITYAADCGLTAAAAALRAGDGARLRDAVALLSPRAVSLGKALARTLPAWSTSAEAERTPDQTAALRAEASFRVAQAWLEASPVRIVPALDALRLALTRAPADAKAYPLTAKHRASLLAQHREVVIAGRALYGGLAVEHPERASLHFLVAEVERHAWIVHREDGANARALAAFDRALAIEPMHAAAATARASLSAVAAPGRPADR